MIHPTLRCWRVLLVVSMVVWLELTTSPTFGAELLGYWALEETNVDDDVIDSSGNGRNGEFEGEVDPTVSLADVPECLIEILSQRGI